MILFQVVFISIGEKIMSTIVWVCERSADGGKYHLCCMKCGKPTDWVTGQELLALSTSDYGASECFRCDDMSDVLVPQELLIDGKLPNCYLVGGVLLETQRDAFFEHLQELFCLSSLRKVNREGESDEQPW